MDELILMAGLGLFAWGAFGALGGATDDTGASGDGGDSGSVQTVSNTTLDAQTVYQLAQQAIGMLDVGDITPEMLTTIASIESSFNPAAVRQEPQINDASYGLVQTLLGTATWLYGRGATAYGAPTADALADPATSLYFGGAYLHYLRNFRGQVRPDSFVVPAYNGGPGNPNGAGPQRYWSTYQQQFSSLGFGTVSA
jgi:hypothetical protein